MNVISFDLVSPEKLLFNSDVGMIIVPGKEGDLGILPGTTRKMISNLSDNINLKYVEEEILVDNVNLMDEAFICSSVVGILPCFWDGWESNFKLTKRLQFLLEESLEK